MSRQAFENSIWLGFYSIQNAPSGHFVASPFRLVSALGPPLSGNGPVLKKCLVIQRNFLFEARKQSEIVKIVRAKSGLAPSKPFIRVFRHVQSSANTSFQRKLNHVAAKINTAIEQISCEQRFRFLKPKNRQLLQLLSRGHSGAER